MKYTTDTEEDTDTDIPTRSWAFFNPKVGLNYALSPQMTFYTSLAFANREPARNDILGAANINAGNITSVRDLEHEDNIEPEQVLDWELGIKSQQGPLQGSLNFFYMDFRNEISPTGRSIDAHYVQLRQNLDKSYRMGFEGDLSFDLGHGFRVSSLGYWMRARIDSYKPADFKVALEDIPTGGAPELQFQLQTDYRLPFFDRLSVFLRGRYYGPTYLNPIPSSKEDRYKSPEQVFLDAGLSLNYPRLQFALHLRNLLDTPYYPMGEISNGEPSYFAQAPLHLYGSLRIQIFEDK